MSYIILYETNFLMVIIYLEKMILKKDCFASKQYKGQYRYYRYKEKFYFEKIKMKNKLVFLRTHYPNNYSDKLNTEFT